MISDDQTATIIRDLNSLLFDCNERKLTEFSKWTAEMLYYAPVMSENSLESMDTACCSLNTKLNISLKMTQALFDNQEFERASIYAKGNDDPLLKFLHFYALFLAGEKKRLDNMTDLLDRQIQFENQYVNRLHTELEEMKLNGSIDAFQLYLYGLVLVEENLLKEAKLAFIQSINQLPYFWPSWHSLSKLIDSKDELLAIHLPDHWMQPLFLGEVLQKLQILHEAVQVYEELARHPVFKDSLYIKTQIAVVYHNLQEPDAIVAKFKEIMDIDQYRMDHIDTYSNSLFVKGLVTELTALAHHCFDVNKYCTETCCVLGNYYSQRGEHEKAIVYFQRAIKLNPNNSGAYTLMGHEFLEFKNTSAACLAYRKALQIDPKDFRAWYGLGQVYDILKMPNYATHYYSMAHKVRPQDSRMIIALGDMYEKHQKFEEAKRCFWKAHSVGDMEGMALLRLGKLQAKMNDNDQAAASYSKYLKSLDDQGISDPEHQPGCYRFLAEYYTNKNQLDEAYEFAQMCLEYDSTKEEAKGILKKICQLRTTSGPPKTPEQRSD